MNIEPTLRFKDNNGKDFPNWQSKKLKDIAHITMGQSPNSSNYNNIGEGVYLIQGNADISGGESNPRSWTSQPTKMCQKGDILLSVRAPVGSVARSIHRACIGRGISAIRNNNQSTIGFLHQFLLAFENKWTRFEQGSTFKAINADDISKLKINTPSVKEQQKIANFFELVDKWIVNLHEQKSDLVKYKKGISQKIFSQEYTFTKNKTLKWEKQKLRTIFDRVTRKNTENNQNVLTISAQQGLITQEKYFNKSVASKNLRGYYLLYKNEFAYNKSYSNGYPMGAIKKLNTHDKGIVSVLYICFRLKDENMSSDFFEHYFEEGNANKEIHKIAQEGARAHGLLNMSIEDFFNIEVIVPPAQEQHYIAEFLSSIDRKIELKNQQINEVKIWKSELLQQMIM